MIVLLAAGSALALNVVAQPAVPAAPPTSQSDPTTLPALGRITGTIQPARVVASVQCLQRAGNMTYKVNWDGATGRFAVADLAPGLRYDLEVTTADGKTFVGVDLSYEEDPLIRLARETSPRPADNEKPSALTDADHQQINDIVTKIEMFEDQRRIVLLAGDHSRATALVELRRTKSFYNDKGQRTRRLELWYFKFQHGGWEKIANAEKILSRVRAPGPQIENQIASRVYLAELGGILVDKAKLSATLDVTLPGYPAASQPDKPAR